jgi:hypothetical protein
MKERILNYMSYIDTLLADDAGEHKLDYDALKREHRTQLDFFMHERHVHLLVMLTFAMLAFADFGLLILSFQPGLIALLLALMVLLVPYIMHYYLLENSVQKMYRQYDEMQRRSVIGRQGQPPLPTLQTEKHRE